MTEGPANYGALSDGALAESIVAGDEQAAVELFVVRCGPALKYLAQGKYRFLGLEFDELVSEVFRIFRQDDWKALRAFRGHNTAGRPCKLTNYVLCIASRMLARRLGNALKEMQWIQPLYEMEVENVPDPAVERQRVGDAVIEAILALDDPMDRTALLMYKVEGRDVGDVAATLKTSPGNVHTRCCRALKKLRELLAEGERV